MNEQIKAELDVFGKEATLAEAKRINGLRAVFGEVICHIFYELFLLLTCLCKASFLNGIFSHADLS